MSVSLRILDDEAWVSASDTREVSVSKLWRLDDPSFCGCEFPDFVVENVLDVGMDDRTVSVKVYGQCITCGQMGVPGWVPAGRLREGEFVDIDRERVVLPVRRGNDDEQTTLLTFGQHREGLTVHLGPYVGMYMDIHMNAYGRRTLGVGGLR